MQLRIGLTLSLVALSLVGCARFGLDNSSLDYKQTQTVDTLKVPEGINMRPQQALYPTPEISPEALKQAPEFTNKHGNQFEMPRPKAPNVANAPAVIGSAPSQPQLVTGGNGIPLLKIDGANDQVWKYVVATLSTANLTAETSKNPFEANIEYNDQSYRLRLTSSGSSNLLGLYDDSNNFADATIANELLTLIHQNWPA